jgi:glycosyltransferase involved in cell wall biosynthesis
MPPPVPGAGPKLLFLVTEDWYFCSHRLPLARAARDNGYQVLVATRVTADGERIRREGFELISLRLRRRRSSPWNEVASLIELVNLYRREKPDIVHHVAMKPVIYGSIAALLARVPRIVNALAGFGYIFTSTHVRARLLRMPVRLALRGLLSAGKGRTIVQNPDDRRALDRLGIPEARIAVIPGSGVDVRTFHPVAEPEGPIVVCMVSRMLWDKGVGELATAARLLKADIPSLRVWLVGPPDPENPASISEEQLGQWAEEGILEWLGPQADVAAIWRRAHIAVLPSYREGLPKSLLEAAASGRPMVATDVPGCREIVTENETGLLVPARDAVALAAALARLAGDAAHRQRMGAAARERVVERFSQERIASETLALYRSLAPNPCRAFAG